MPSIFRSWATASTSGVGGVKKLTRSDFKKIDLKGLPNHWYYSFIDLYLDIEITLEPCMNGFCVGFWKNSDGSLLNKKICTNLEEMIFKEEEDLFKAKKEIPKGFCDSLRQKEILYGILERSELAWDKALSIANQLYRRKRNEETLRKWKILKDEGWKEDSSSETWRLHELPGDNVTINPFWNSSITIDPKYLPIDIPIISSK